MLLYTRPRLWETLSLVYAPDMIDGALKGQPEAKRL